MDLGFLTLQQAPIKLLGEVKYLEIATYLELTSGKSNEAPLITVRKAQETTWGLSPKIVNWTYNPSSVWCTKKITITELSELHLEKNQFKEITHCLHHNSGLYFC